MKSNGWIVSSTKLLQEADVDTARLDTLVLLSDVTGKDRTHLLAHPEIELSNEQLNQLQKLLNRRVKHEPLAYIRRKSEFYGREFAVNKYVLEPRPESETIIQLLKNVSLEQNIRTVIDVGTGSGALAVTAKLELPKAKVFGIDIDQNCLKVAKTNAQKHEVDIEFLQGNLFEPIFNQKIDDPITILANLPYVPDGYQINEAATHEPKLALFGGVDGLDLYRTMFQQLNEHLNQPTIVLTEALPSQHHELANIARAQNYIQIAKDDFIQVFSNS